MVARKTTDEEIRNCFYELIEEGEYPSVLRIKRRIGGGSNRIQSIIEKLREEAQELNLSMPSPHGEGGLQDGSGGLAEGGLPPSFKETIQEYERKIWALNQKVGLLNSEVNRLEAELEAERARKIEEVEAMRDRLMDAYKETDEKLREQRKSFTAILSQRARNPGEN